MNTNHTNVPNGIARNTFEAFPIFLPDDSEECGYKIQDGEITVERGTLLILNTDPKDDPFQRIVQVHAGKHEGTLFFAMPEISEHIQRTE